MFQGDTRPVAAWRRAVTLCAALFAGLCGSASAGIEAFKLTRLQADVYIDRAQRTVVLTRGCVANVTADIAVVTTSLSATGDVRFSTGTRCPVDNVFVGHTVAGGDYALQVRGSQEVYLSVDDGWLLETEYCSAQAAGQSATLSLTRTAVNGDAYGSLKLADGQRCEMWWLYRSRRTTAELPGTRLARADLVVEAISAPLHAVAGQPLAAPARLRNRGAAPSEATRTLLLLSKDEVRSDDDTELAQCETPALAPDAATDCAFAPTLPESLPAGSYHLLVLADADERLNEPDELNNLRTAGPLQLQAPAAYELRVDRPAAGTLSADGGSLSCDASICRLQAAPGSRVTLSVEPAAGWLFSGWSGACSGLGRCSLLMDRSHSVGLRFVAEQSLLQLPWVTQAEGYLSRFALVNTSDRELFYRFSLVSEAGQTATLNPEVAVGSLAPRSQKIVEMQQLVSGFSGAARASVLLGSSGSRHEMAALYNLVQPSTGSISNASLLEAVRGDGRLGLPWLTLEPQYRTELVLSNASDAPLQASLSVLPQSGDGARLNRSSVELAPRSQLVLPVDELLRAGAASSAGLELSSAAPALRASYVMVHSATGAANSTELATVDDREASSTTLVMPWFSVVGGYDSRFVLVNRGEQAAAYRIELLGEEGNQLGLGRLEGVVPARGQIEIPATQVLTSTSGATRAAAVFTIQAAPRLIEGSYQIRSLATGALNQTVMARPSRVGGASSTLLLPWFSRVGGYLSRFVLVNRGATPAPFTVELLPEAGNAASETLFNGGVVPARGMLVLGAEHFVTAFEKLPRAGAVLRVAAPHADIEALYNIVNPATGSISNTLLSHVETADERGATLPPALQRAALNDVLGNASVGIVQASDPSGRPLSFTLVGAPQHGTVSVDAVSGRFRYVAAPGAPALSDRFEVAVFNGVRSVIATVEVHRDSDPLFAQQWHLWNTGQSSFASALPVAGNDINVLGAWAMGYSGRGVRLAIVDSGVEIAHPDLAEGVDLASSHNLISHENDPTPVSKETSHGTLVAGVAAARGFNGKGGRGVAYESRLRSYNYLESQTLLNYWAVLGGMEYSQDNDVFNLSIGASGDALPSHDEFDQEIVDQLQTLRGGRGAALVAAAGNEFIDAGDDVDCSQAQRFGVSCLIPAVEVRNGSHVPIQVGALRADGRRSSYSSSGSSLWISAPGGEFGYHRDHYSSSDPTTFEPALISTDRSFCFKTGAPFNALDTLNANPLAPQCEYTALMNGTSAAAPVVSGVVALMLEANPRLTVRDIKHILASTARQVHAEHVGTRAAGLLNSGELVLEQGWVRNAAGFAFNNWYGFGAVDAARAVEMARGLRSLLPPRATVRDYVYSAPAASLVPRGSRAGFPIGVQVDEPATTVESVELYFSLAGTPGLNCNQIELESPAGTRSILLHAGTGLANRSVDNARLVSHAFYGEPLNGRWTLRFLDVCAAGEATLLSTARDQRLVFVAR